MGWEGSQAKKTEPGKEPGGDAKTDREPDAEEGEDEETKVDVHKTTSQESCSVASVSSIAGPEEEEKVEDLLQRSFKAKLTEKKWSGGKKMPDWAMDGLARDLSHVGRQQARQEQDVVNKSLGDAGGALPRIAIENNPSVRESKSAISQTAPSYITPEPVPEVVNKARDLRRTERQRRKEAKKAKVDAFRNIFSFRRNRFTYDELDTALYKETANKGNMLGVRALAGLIYRTQATKTPTSRVQKVEMQTSDGARIIFDPNTPYQKLADDPIRAKLFEHSTVEDNTLYNLGITTKSPGDAVPTKAKGGRRVHFNPMYSTELYDPVDPDNRRKSDRQHRRLVVAPSPPPMPRGATGPPPPPRGSQPRKPSPTPPQPAPASSASSTQSRSSTSKSAPSK